MNEEKKSAFQSAQSETSASRSWSRRAFLNGAAVLAGATIVAPAEIAAQSKDSSDTHIASGDSACYQSGFSEPSVLPEWAIGPFIRYANPQTVPYQGNPLFRPREGWEDKAVYNPGVVYRSGKFHMLFRGQSRAAGNISQIGYAYSTDGYNFTRYDDNPVITTLVPNGTAGAEDPRLYELDGTYYAFFTGYSGTSIDIDEAVSTDLVHWSHIRSVIKNNKNAAVVADPSGRPVKIDGRYAMYYGQNGNGTFIAFSTDMMHWTDSKPINMHFPDSYTPYEICVAVTDYPSIQGGPRRQDILMFVAGTLMADGRWYYAISEVLFSGTDLTRQMGQLTVSILQPEASYEMLGQTKATVFMNTILFHEGEWWMYYGAGDTVVALAKAPLRSEKSVQAYHDFTGTSFELGQRQPDWINEVDLDPGGGGIKNVSSMHRTASGQKAPAQYNPTKFEPKLTSAVAGPEVIVRHGEKSHSGEAALRYSGLGTSNSDNYAYLKIFDLSAAPVMAKQGMTLSYWVYPQGATLHSGGEAGHSGCVAIDLIFSDGTALRNLGARDQQGHDLTPAGQGQQLKVDQWNYVESKVGSVADGKQVIRVDVGVDLSGTPGPYHGYIDDIQLVSL